LIPTVFSQPSILNYSMPLFPCQVVSVTKPDPTDICRSGLSDFGELPRLAYYAAAVLIFMAC